MARAKRKAAVPAEKAPTFVYVDGFNLYYGALQNTDHKWLDLGRFCQIMLPEHHIGRIHYFTARVKPRPGDPSTAPQRQQIYLRALATIPNVELHYGFFLTHPQWLRLTHPPETGPKYVEVWRTEEKGSDVNLAAQMLVDGYNGHYSCAVVISNDSDLAKPVQIVREQLGLPVGVLNPRRKRSIELSPHPLPADSFYRPIRAGAVAASQFPDTLRDRHGGITKPPEWNPKK